MELREQMEEEARAAAAALPALEDAAVERALLQAAERLRASSAEIVARNAVDVEAARDLDEGTRDRLRLDPARIEAMAAQTEATALLAPLEREGPARTLANGLRISEARIPIGVVGANFEARPNVAIDIAAQLLKSLNSGLLRTGGAALRTVTYLVDEILRPSLVDAGLPPEAVGLVRSSEREGARQLVQLPGLVPLVILRGSGPSTADLARLAAANGVQALAHAEGGGVLYVHGSADADKARTLVEASLDRLGVCNRLNLLLVEEGSGLAAGLKEAIEGLELEVRLGPRAAGRLDGLALDVELGHEWAGDAERVATVTLELVDGIEEAARIANEATSALAAGIVAEDESAVDMFFRLYRGTSAFWHAPTRFADGFELTASPETGINVGFGLGPRGPVTYEDLFMRQYRIVGDGSQRR